MRAERNKRGRCTTFDFFGAVFPAIIGAPRSVGLWVERRLVQKK